jgi:hypothetical protein
VKIKLRCSANAYGLFILLFLTPHLQIFHGTGASRLMYLLSSAYTYTLETKTHTHINNNCKPHEGTGPSPVAGGVSP